jgi:hypothetical protein
VLNAGEDWDLHKRMLGLEESMKLIKVVLKIRGVDKKKTKKKNIRAFGGTSNVKIPSKKLFMYRHTMSIYSMI